MEAQLQEAVEKEKEFQESEALSKKDGPEKFVVARNQFVNACDKLEAQMREDLGIPL